MVGDDGPADVELTGLGRLDRIANGGQGTVFRLPDRPGRVLKLYHDGLTVRGDELRTLIERPARMRPGDRAVLAAATAWPRCRVLEHGRCVGLLMDEVPGRFGIRLAGHERLREVQYLLYPRRPLWRELVLPDARGRRALLLEYLRVFGVLHANRMIAGDVSMKNLLWTLEPRPGVFVLDCDGFRCADRRPVTAQADTVGWADPAAPGSATLDSDRYKIALLVLRVLLANHAITPQGLTERADLRAGLSERLAALARRARQAGARPSVESWQQALREAGPPSSSAPGSIRTSTAH